MNWELFIGGALLEAYAMFHLYVWFKTKNIRAIMEDSN